MILQAAYQRKDAENPNYIDVFNGKARRVYDTPDKGIFGAGKFLHMF